MNEAMRESDRGAPDRIAVPGVTCWRRCRAERVAFLVDGEQCFAAIGESLLRAQRSVLITGWDLHSAVRLWRGPGAAARPATLGELLRHLVRTRRRLHVHVLVWDFAMIFAAERELFSPLRRWWGVPRRLHFHYDAAHPTGGAHHQKIVVVDDAVAFAGGFDLSARRWDTREHRAADPQRVDPWGKPYPPFHDVQMAVDGEAASALGDLVRERWRRATGRRLRPPRVRGDRWPAVATPHLRDTTVAIARTLPAWEDAPAVREVERLYVHAIEAARHTIYIENQYFTSDVVGEALARSLSAPSGPEIHYVGPRVCPGWIEERTMGVLRARLLARLEAADRHGRLHAWAVRAPGDDDVPVNVHAKVLVVDDRHLQIGSANLSNRSLALDSECDLAVEAAPGSPEAQAIEAFRDGLLAEHLHVKRDTLASVRRQMGSLARAVERLRGRHGTLEPLCPRVESGWEEVLADARLADPVRPLAPDEVVSALLATSEPIAGAPAERRATSAWGLVAGGVGLAALLVLWQVLPERTLEPERLAAGLTVLRQWPLGPPAATVAGAVAASAMIPFVPLVLASGMLFGPWTGFAVALGAGLMSAAMGYGLGRWLWGASVQRLAGRRTERLRRILARGGVPAMTVLRIVPVAPFAVVNLAAGSVGVSARDFMLGTLLGLAPGVFALTVLGDGVLDAVRRPRAETILVVAALAIVVVAGIVWGQRFAARRLAAAEQER